MNTALDGVFDWVLRTSLQASVLALAVLLVQALLRARLAPRWRYALWGVVVLRLVLPFGPSSAHSVFNWVPQPHFDSAPSGGGVIPGRADSQSVAGAWRPQEASGHHPYETRSGGVPGNSAPAPGVSTQRQSGEGSSWGTGVRTSPGAAATAVPGNDTRLSGAAAPRQSAVWRAQEVSLALAWFLVALPLLALLILRSLVLSRRLARLPVLEDRAIQSSPAPGSAGQAGRAAGMLFSELLRECQQAMGVRRRITVRAAPELFSPAVTGIFRPTILLPPALMDTLTREQLRHVLLHELAHIKRHDIALNWLLLLLNILHWFNPVLWYAFRRLRSDRELARDAMALRVAGHDAGACYAETLLHLLQRPRALPFLPVVAGIFENHAGLKRRIVMASQHQLRSKWSLLAVSLLILLGYVGLTDAKAGAPVETAAPATVPAPMPDLFAEAVGAPAAVPALPTSEVAPEALPVEVPQQQQTDAARGATPTAHAARATSGEEKSQIEMMLESPVSIEFEDSDLYEVMAFISDSFGLNVVIDQRAVARPATATVGTRTPGQVDGKVTYINLKDVTLESALEALLRPLNLDFAVRPEFLFISSPSLLKTEDLEARIGTAGESLPRTTAEVGFRPPAPPQPPPRPQERLFISPGLPGLVPPTVQHPAGPAPAPPPPDRATITLNTLARMADMLDIYVAENGSYPPLMTDPMRLMFDLEAVYPEYLSAEDVMALQVGAKGPYLYLGYLIPDVDTLRRFVDHLIMHDPLPHQDLQVENGRIVHLRKGVERFLITDISDPAGSSEKAKARVPVMLERHGNSEDGTVAVLFLDGNVEHVPHGTFPNVPEFWQEIARIEDHWGVS